MFFFRRKVCHTHTAAVVDRFFVYLSWRNKISPNWRQPKRSWVWCEVKTHKTIFFFRVLLFGLQVRISLSARYFFCLFQFQGSFEFFFFFDFTCAKRDEKKLKQLNCTRELPHQRMYFQLRLHKQRAELRHSTAGMWKLEFLFIALLIRFSRRAMRAANHRPFQLNSI